MRSIKELIRLKYEGKLSVRQISQILSVGKSSVGDYLSRFRASGLSYPIDDNITEEELEQRLFDEVGRPKGIQETIDFDYLDAELRRPNVTLQLLWEEYKQENESGYQYSWYCELYREHQKKKSVSMRQVHKYGEKGFCDFGTGLRIYDAQTKNWKDTHLFVFVWGASNYTYAEATFSEKTRDWIKGNVNAIHFSGCVPKAIVPDQPKSVVSQSCHYDPGINPTFIEFSEHYQTHIFPARPGKPKDKSKAELGVKIAKRWILAKLRNRVFYSLGELNEAIDELQDQLNAKPMKKYKKSRQELFDLWDKPYALSVPDHRYEVSEWKVVSVNIDHHIEFDDHYYSVPYILIRRRLEVRATSTLIEVFNKTKRVATHQRSFANNTYTTLVEHRPPSHQKFLEWTPERILEWATKYGSHVEDLIQTILASRRYPEQAYRTCLGIIRLEKRFSKERLNMACKRALEYKLYTYSGVKNVLLKGLDLSTPAWEETLSSPSLQHDNVRGSTYFLSSEKEITVDRFESSRKGVDSTLTNCSFPFYDFSQNLNLKK